MTPHHLAAGCDVVWNLGTGYFGCRTPDGDFHPERFVEVVSDPRIKMVEIKLSQGAKPGHGGLLPAAKVTEEISRIRGIPMGQACHSPPAHAGHGERLYRCAAHKVEEAAVAGHGLKAGQKATRCGFLHEAR